MLSDSNSDHRHQQLQHQYQHQQLQHQSNMSNTTSPTATAPGDSVTPAANSKQFPPPKTDKPRPHTCGTCQRSFARLEHLKRHERSHTKEKPFECPECTRCFARRDLLLRHQQKLHMTTTPSSRPRNRRESASSTMAGTGAGRVRKPSTANSNGVTTSMRPRANTISHVDGAAMELMAAAHAGHARQRNNNNGHPHGHGHHPSMSGLPMHSDFNYGGMSAVMEQKGFVPGLPKLETQGLNNLGFGGGGGLRTAPPIGGFDNTFELDNFLIPSGSTINPNALHYTDSPNSMALDGVSPQFQSFPDLMVGQQLDDTFDWVNGFENQMSFEGSNENAVDGSSPSAMSTASQSGISEVMLDGSNNPATSTMWQTSMIPPTQITPNPFNLDFGSSGFQDLMNGGPLSPNSIPPKSINEQFFSPPLQSMNGLSPAMGPDFANLGSNQSMPFRSRTPPPPPLRQSVIEPNSPALTITNATRHSLMVALSQCTSFGARKHSISSVASPMSSVGGNGLNDASRSLPSTLDLQGFVAAYIQYFHPHLPFLHLPTLSFDEPFYNNLHDNVMFGGRGCLVLSMAAIGALYELDITRSRELFESAKKMIQLYLEERRKADVRKVDLRGAGGDGSRIGSETSHTPVWLVQSMLLNVVYGHNCGDKTAGDIASTHCAALVSLARAAELVGQLVYPAKGLEDVHMMGSSDSWTGGKNEESSEEAEWQRWRKFEERKRTLYAVFILSSLLVSAYNHTPALTNSEIIADLPCDEDFWAADSAISFQAMGGSAAANHNQMTFHDALGELLRTSEKQQQQHNGNTEYSSDLKPSTFGCFVLINALHNYIWETRQRHHNKVWTNEETEKMHRHIEPALKAWRAAWSSNPRHSLERPNPFGTGPLSADSIPLLDLAYVRLFVNLSRSKEKFWQRDYDGMAEELSRGNEIIQHAEHWAESNTHSVADTSSTAPSEHSGSIGGTDSPPTSNSSPDFDAHKMPLPSTAAHFPQNIAPLHHHHHHHHHHPATAQSTSSSSKRERHLRKAAFFAADSLSVSDKLGVTFADFNSRELPLQSAMCTFDCAQVLAEWLATVQERVGPYVGVLGGREEIDPRQVPCIMLLEEEDCQLLVKIQEILTSVELKMNFEGGGASASSSSAANPAGLANPANVANVGGVLAGNAAACGGLLAGEEGGYACKILKVTAYMLDKAAVWPVTRLMARSLETQANHMRARAERSVMKRVD